MLKSFRRLGPTSIIAPIFTRNALSAATLPIYPGLGQAPNNAGWHIPGGFVVYVGLQPKEIITI